MGAALVASEDAISYANLHEYMLAHLWPLAHVVHEVIKQMPATKERKSKKTPGFVDLGSGTLDVDAFCKTFQLKRDAITRMTGYSPRAVAGWASGQRLSQSSLQRLTEIQRLCEALSKIVKSASVGGWLQQPNDAFDGSTPLQVIERGETDRLWRMIYRLESGEPG